MAEGGCQGEAEARPGRLSSVLLCRYPWRPRAPGSQGEAQRGNRDASVMVSTGPRPGSEAAHAPWCHSAGGSGSGLATAGGRGRVWGLWALPGPIIQGDGRVHGELQQGLLMPLGGPDPPLYPTPPYPTPPYPTVPRLCSCSVGHGGPAVTQGQMGRRGRVTQAQAEAGRWTGPVGRTLAQKQPLGPWAWSLGFSWQL